MELPRQRMFSDRTLMQILVPLVIEQTLANLVGLCDGVMVSAAGEAAISGVSLVNQIVGVILVLFTALATGGTVVTSQFLGAQQKDKAKQSAGQLVLLAGGLGLLLTTVCLLFAPVLLRLFFGSVDDNVMEASLIYFRVNALSFPFIAVYNAGAAIFRSIGNSKVSMKVGVVKNVTNIVGNAICIYGLHMGVEGVAIPTLVSRIVGAVIIMILVSDPKQELCVRPKDLMHIESSMMGKIMQVGIPTAFENCLFQLGRVLVTGMVAVWGTAHIAANATANNIGGIAIIISQSIGVCAVTVVGQCLGARDTEQAKFYVKKLLLWCYIAQGILQFLLLVFQDPIIGLYSNLSAETVAIAKQMVTLYMICGILMYPISFMLPNALRAANDGTYTMAVSVLSMALCRIAMAYVLCIALGWGSFGTWVAMIMDWVVRAIFFVTRWLSGKWQRKCFLT